MPSSNVVPLHAPESAPLDKVRGWLRSVLEGAGLDEAATAEALDNLNRWVEFLDCRLLRHPVAPGTKVDPGTAAAYRRNHLEVMGDALTVLVAAEIERAFLKRAAQRAET